MVAEWIQDATRAPADAKLPDLVPLIEFGASPRATTASRVDEIPSALALA